MKPSFLMRQLGTAAIGFGLTAGTAFAQTAQPGTQDPSAPRANTQQQSAPQLIQNNMRPPERVEVPVATPQITNISTSTETTSTAPRPAKSKHVKKPMAMLSAVPNAPPAEHIYPSQALSLYVGESKLVDQRGVNRIAIGNGKLVSATVVDDRQILILAESPGNTMLHVWLKSGYEYDLDLHVDTSSQKHVFEEVSGLLAGVKGVTARMVGEKVVIDGEYTDAESFARVKSVTDHYPQVINQIPVRPTSGKVYDARMVYLEVKVVELSKSALDRIGVQWDTAINGPTAATSGFAYANSSFRGVAPATGSAGSGTVGYPTTTTANPFTSFIGLATQITSTINFMEENGDGWTLAEPRMSCLSGEKARFQVGGEIPIPVSSGLGTVSIVYHPYGVILELEPVADSRGVVTTKIGAEVSDIDAANSSSGLTAFTMNKTETVVTMHVDQTLILSGLLKNVGNKTVEQIPGLGNLPVLGALFRNKQFQNQKTEVIVLVTPRLVSAESQLNVEQVRDGNMKLERIKDLIETRIAD
jgi:pilus assembly protein CpaC